MNRSTLSTRIVLVALVGLLALPIAQSASQVGAKDRSRIVTRTFRNSAAIAIPASAGSTVVSADLYPSTIAVNGMKGKIRDVNLRLNGFEHTYPDEVHVLLVGPRGQTAIVMPHVGGASAVEDVTLRLDDEAQASLPQTQLQSGAFRPTNFKGKAIAFNNPAPSTNASSALSVFDGGNPNGRWHLFVLDDDGPVDSGVFAEGWALEIEARGKNTRGKKRQNR